MKCLLCKYFDSYKSENVTEYTEGNCRRYAPKPEFQTRIPIRYGEVKIGVYWPVVYAGSWCGEFEPKTEQGEKNA